MTHLERNRKYRATGGEELKIAHRWQMRFHRLRKVMLSFKKQAAKLQVILCEIQESLDSREDCHCAMISDRPCEKCWGRIRENLQAIQKKMP